MTTKDALDHRSGGKPRFSKAQKRKYARKKAMEELLLPPKNPPPAWLSDPSLLPTKPPRSRSTDTDEDEP